MIVYSQTSVRQRAPEPKKPEPEKKRTRSYIYRRSPEYLAALEVRRERVRELWPTHTAEEIRAILGYADKCTVNRIAKELGLPPKNRYWRRA